MPTINVVSPPLRLPRRLYLLLAATAFALVAGLASVAVPEPEPAAAACRVAWGGCGGLDLTRTSTLRVDHRETPSGDLVEPDTGETWDIDVHYSPAPGVPCVDQITNVTAVVTKAATGWAVSCTGCSATNGPVRSIGICDDSSECAVDTHGHAYVLKVDLDMQNGLGANLNSVVYTTDSVDDGDTLNSTCGSEVASVSPTSQTFTATDTTFPCSLDCAQDTSVTITYN
jgi:hypothetical protein